MARGLLIHLGQHHTCGFAAFRAEIHVYRNQRNFSSETLATRASRARLFNVQTKLFQAYHLGATTLFVGQLNYE